MSTEITSNIASVIADAIRSQKYVLRLYISGPSTRSYESIRNIGNVCREHLGGKYDLEVIDMQQHRVLEKDEQIIANSTLIKLLPDPLRRIIGDFSTRDCALFGMDIKRKEDYLNSKAALRHGIQEQSVDFVG